MNTVQGCMFLCPPNEIPCWRLFQNLEVTDKTHKSGKQLAKMDSTCGICGGTQIPIVAKGMNWCDLYWFVLGMMPLHYTPFSYLRVWLAVHLHFDAPQKNTTAEIQAWCTTKPKSRLDSLKSSNLGSGWNKSLPENYLFWTNNLQTHSLSMGPNTIIQYPTLWHGSFYLLGEQLLLTKLDSRSVTSLPAQLRFLA